MPDILHIFSDPHTWPPAATGIGIIVTTILWFLNQRKKALGYKILWSNPLVNLSEDNQGRLEVHFDGNPVHDAHLLMIQLVNSGHIAIKPSEYAQPIAISLGNSAKIILAEVVETNPPELSNTFDGNNQDKNTLIEKIEQNRIIIKPLLLNSHESITIQILVNQFIGKVAVTGRIEGISNISRLKDRHILPTILINGGIIFIVIQLLIVNPDYIYHFSLPGLLPTLLGVILGGILIATGIAVSPHKKSPFEIS